jgi:rhamnosyltransferase
MRQTHEVAAIIVTYFPDENTLNKLISILLADTIPIILVDNGGGRATVASRLPETMLTVIDLGGNSGLGNAINIGIAEAKKGGFRYVVTFDQDSCPSNGMVKALATEFQQQLNRGVKIGAVGPLFVDQRQEPPLVHPFIRLSLFGSGHRYCDTDDDLILVDTLITSGCLTSLEVLDTVGPMDQNYFVDYTDLEWSFRARSKGFSLFGVCKAKMTHELGKGQTRRLLGMTLFEYSPIRRYYFARNCIAVVRLRYVSMRWKLRLINRLLSRCLMLPWAPRTARKLLKLEARMSFRGILDGLAGVQGQLRERA